jgi:hyaluronan synthase
MRPVLWVLRRIFQIVILAYALVIAGFVWTGKDMTIGLLSQEPLLVGYSIAAGIYVLVRSVGARLHRDVPDVKYRPAVSVIIPTFNEEHGIIARIESCLAVDYPEHLLEVIVVNDGSTDKTWERILEAKQRWPELFALDLGRHYGRRRAMAEGIRRAKGHILTFVDSNSYLERDAIKAIVQPFIDGRVGAVVGNASVLNADFNWITKMQQVWCYSAARALKGVESLLSGAVTSASGCWAFRTSMVLPSLEAWEFQTFLGRPANFGDDRALSNCVLAGQRVAYQQSARAYTVVPTKLRRFVRQQLRWKKSWLWESVSVVRRSWRRHPLAALFTGVTIALPLMAPFVVYPLAGRVAEGNLSAVWFSLIGTYAAALLYSLFYAFKHQDGRWHHAMMSVPFYMCFLVFQTYWAIATMGLSRMRRKATVDRRPIEQSLITALNPAEEPLPVAIDFGRLMEVAR